MNTSIKFHKWNRKDKKILSRSCDELMDIKEVQFYQPYFSLYFHVHNTSKSHQTIDIKRRYYMKEILEVTNQKYHTSNTFLKCKIFDSSKNINIIKETFCKCIPLLDPLYYLMSNYNTLVNRNNLLPSCYNYNTYEKINNMNNNAYIDTFFSFICSQVTLNNLSPSFPIYYGSLNGIKKEYNFDISEDYNSLKNEKWFHKNLNKFQISVDMYISSDEESDDEESDDEESDDEESDDEESDDEESDDKESENEGSDDEESDESSLLSFNSSTSSGSSNKNDYIILLKNLPCQFFFIEKLQGTLEDILTNIEDLNIEVILSCIFQISFALMYLQKHYSFTHNDLHINNVMFTSTTKTFIYYKYNNIYFKVPTFGYIFKIIDFGRSVFKFHNKLFFNDTFEKHGEAEGQYSKPFNKLLFKDNNEPIIKQNFHFDLCRLAITILDVCNFDKNKNYLKKQSFVDFIYNMTLTENCESLYNLEDNFHMYISIAKYSSNALPKNIIQNIIFNKYRIKKKSFPKHSYYTC